jgi:hypothetical protein
MYSWHFLRAYIFTFDPRKYSSRDYLVHEFYLNILYRLLESSILDVTAVWVMLAMNEPKAYKEFNVPHTSVLTCSALTLEVRNVYEGVMRFYIK